jgi:putative transposase
VPTNAQLYYAYTKWVYEEYAHRPQRGHLGGKTPWEVFEPSRGPGFSAEGKDRLNILLAAREVRRIARDGIRLPGSDVRYYHPDLYGRQLQSAVVRYDWTDRSRIYVYDCSGAFICVAEPRKKIHPAAAHLGSDGDVDDLKQEIAQQRSLAKSTLGPAREIFEREILPEVSFQQAYLGLTGSRPSSSAPCKQLSSPGETPADPQELSQSELADMDEVLLELEAEHARREMPPWEKARSLSDFDRYEALVEMEADGTSLPQAEKNWMSLFERGDMYKRHKDHFEQYQMKIAYLHGA